MRKQLTPIIALIVALNLGTLARAQDEVGGFFGGARLQPTKDQIRELKAFWRKAQIGAREDRLVARSDIVEFGSVAIDFLEKNLQSGSAADVRTSAMILTRIGDRAVAEKIRSLLFESEKTVAARRHLALALGVLGDARDIENLLSELKKNKRNDYRRALVHACGQLGHTSAAPVLVAEYQKDKSQVFRRAVLLALGRIGGPQATELIRKALKSSKESVRRAATIAAANLRSPQLVGDFRKLLKDSDGLVVRYALIGLSLVESVEVSAAIKKAGVVRSSHDELRALAITALGMQADDLSFELLKERGKSKLERHNDVRRALAFAFGRRPRAMTPAIRKRLQSSRDPEVGRALWCAMTLRPQKISGVFLAEAIGNKALHDRVRLTLLDLLAFVDPDRAEPLFEELRRNLRFKKKVRVRSAELLEILQRESESGRDLMRARIQVEIDDLGGSPEWNLMEAIHRDFLGIESIERPLAIPGGGARPQGGGQPARRLDPWTGEDEDLRLWLDRFHYYDRRLSLDVIR